MDVDITTKFPPGALTGGDKRRSFRNTVASAARRTGNRHLRRIRSDERIAEGIRESVEFAQESDAETLSFMFTSDNPAINYYRLGTPLLKSSYDQPPPVSRGDEHDIAGWAERHGLDPYAVQQAIFLHGTPAHPELDELLDAAMDEIEGQVEQKSYDWAVAWGDERYVRGA